MRSSILHPLFADKRQEVTTPSSWDFLLQVQEYWPTVQPTDVPPSLRQEIEQGGNEATSSWMLWPAAVAAKAAAAATKVYFIFNDRLENTIDVERVTGRWLKAKK
jgi:hypothetical protein